MNESKDLKRLFFGFEVHAPWPENLPSGRLLAASDRHMTVAFLGNVSYEKVYALLSDIPKPSFKIGLTGHFDKCLILPERHPHVVAWHQQWWDDTAILQRYQTELVQWFQANGFSFRNTESFLPHVTLSREPFIKNQWLKSFTPLPFYIKDLHLYESMGSLVYKPIWTHPIKSPFEALDHTADIAFTIRGETLEQIYRHAQIALAFRYPLLIPYFSDRKEIENLDDIIIALNDMVSQIDHEIGCPFKAVSFHGELVKEEDALKWEMIVDV